MVKGIIFDMDGVLVDSESFYEHRRKDFLQRMEFTAEGEQDFTGSNERAIWEALVPEDSEFREELLMGYRAFRRLHPVPYGELLDEQVPGLFHQFKSRRLKIGIASSSAQDAVESMVKAADIGSLVDYIISGEDCTAHKPAPEIYLRALEGLGLSPEEAFAVEDSPTGIAAAKNAGLRVYALKPRHGKMDQSAATAVIGKLTDLLDLL